MYDYDRNAILDEPIKNMQAVTIRNEFLKVRKVPKTRGSNPKLYSMENECSRDLKETIKKYEIDFQLAPPHMHRRNAAEQSIRNYKNHFISGFSMTDPDFPIRKWDRLLSQ